MLKNHDMKKVLRWIKQRLMLAGYFLRSDEWSFNKFPDLDRYNGRKALVMGNGPSLKELLKKYRNGEACIPQDSFFVNFAPLDPLFYEIKPLHLCISDFIFARDTPGRTEMTRRLYDLLEAKVDWDLTIYLNFTKREYCRQLIDYSRIKNPNIRFVFLNRKHCSELIPRLRHELYKKGLFMPEEGTVVNTAIYLALIEGYKEIELYGVEHNMFLNLRVDERNRLCIYEKNFYDAEGKMVPVINDTDGSTAHIHEYMHFIYVMFRSHYLLRQFADYMGATVWNCTPGSLIDVYERR